MAIVVTVKMRPRYGVRATPNRGASDAEIFDHVTGYRKARRPHQSEYSVLDWVHTAEYLSNRVAGYPVPCALIPLRTKHNEDRRKKKR